jgi:3-oxoadipate CoA-transferase beta subunit
VTGFGGTGFLSKAQMAALVARDIPAGSYVNLGIGLPTMVADYLPPESGVTLHTENGMLGMGPRARGDEVDPDLINAGKVPVTELPGASYFDQAQSFGMIRGGHIGVCVLGAFQVSVSGDLANWSTAEPGSVPAVGGAMDLAIGAREVFVMMSLLAKDGRPKIVPECTYPLTALRCVSRVYTERAVILVTGQGMAIRDVFGTSVPELSELLNLPLVTVG